MIALLPNIITVVRIVLVLPTAWLLWEARYVEALILTAVAGASDAVDGWMARRFDAISHFGAALDPVADKLLVASLYVIFALQGHLPVWLAVIVLGRDLVIFTGAVVYRLLFGHIEFAPTLISKANTAMQITTALATLVMLCGLGLVSEVTALALDPWGFYLLAALGIASGADYVATWGMRAWREAGS
jgi:cardiolipin synthase